MTVAELIEQLASLRNPHADLQIVVSPTHGQSCAHDDRVFIDPDISVIGGVCMLTVADHEWEPR